METLTFTCKIITPMFLAGADGKTPELRAASVKGALRFWWRACNGHIGLESEVERGKHGAKDKLITPGLRDQESFIFGGTGGNASEGRSSFVLQVRPQAVRTDQRQKLVPHKERGFEAPAFMPDQTFEVVLRLPKVKGKDYQVKPTINGQEQLLFTREKLIALFQLTCLLGGVGRRARRGMGSLEIVEARSSQDTPIDLVPNPSLSELHGLLSVLTPHYRLQEKSNRIQNVYSGRMSKYPWIAQIEIGQRNNDPTRKISDATHEVKAKDPRRYEPSMGHSFKGRFASPLYTSVLPDGRPIITTLNTIPDRDIPLIDRNLQEDFKRRVL
jgi:CRISPR-associated protein Cmr1